MTRRDPRESRHAAMLRKVPFLAELDRSSMAELAHASRTVKASKGEDLFTEGEPCRGMFLLLSGSMKVYRAAASGREQILAIESPGATIAELPLLDGGAYPASCAALEESELLLLPREAFADLLLRRPEVTMGVLRVICHRLRYLVALVEEVSLLEVPQRLAKYLLEISERRGSDFTLTLSNREIANRLGTVREIVSRCLHRLAEQGAIQIERRRIRILSKEALRALIEES